MIHASEIALFKGQIDDTMTDVNQAMRDAQKGDNEAATKLGDLQATLASLREQLGKSEKEAVIADQNLEAEEQRKDDAAYKKEIDEKLAQQAAAKEDYMYLDSEGVNPKQEAKVAEAVTAPTAAVAAVATPGAKKDEEKVGTKAVSSSSEAST